MRVRDPAAFLFDALAAAQAIERFLSGCPFPRYEADEMLRSAVERQFEILGESLSRALKADPGLAQCLPDAPRVIAFRNVLAHDYDAVVDETVFAVATFDLPLLAKQLQGLLKDVS